MFRRYPDDMEHQLKPSVAWGGKRWWLNNGYYCNRRGEPLHRAIYASVYGPIGMGLDIHHKDHDKTNNAIENLEAINRSDHLKLHRPRGWRADTPEVRSKRRKEQWAKREPWEAICGWCGQHFATAATVAKYCSPACAQMVRRRSRSRNPSSKCACGKSFILYRPDLKFCSKECAAQFKRRRPKHTYKKTIRKKVCAFCQSEFIVRHPSPVCCSKRCGYLLRRQRTAARRAAAGL